MTVQLSTLPVARLCFRPQLAPEQIRAAYRDFTRPHPRYKVFRHKSMGMALIDLARFDSPLAYLDSIRTRGYGAPQGEKARLRGYHWREIERAAYIEEIRRLTMPEEERQVWPAEAASATKAPAIGEAEHFRSYGTFDPDGRLVAYCRVGVFGNFASAEQLAGYKNRDGVLYLMLTEIICALIADGEVDYFMYDSFLGVRSGLRKFKRKLGFAPYRVRYALA